MAGLGGPYCSKQDVVTFFLPLKSDLVVADISDLMLNSTTEIINQKTGAYWDLFIGSLYLDGQGTNEIVCPHVPIVTLTALVIIRTDLTEETIDVAGSDRQIWYNPDTGLIRRISSSDNEDIARDVDETPLFPFGMQNLKITGSFGRDNGTDVANILKLLQIMLIGQILARLYPSNFKLMDLVQERIGEYEYRIGDMQYSKDPKNAKLTMEGYINYLFSILPKDDQMEVLAI